VSLLYSLILVNRKQNSAETWSLLAEHHLSQYAWYPLNIWWWAEL